MKAPDVVLDNVDAVHDICVALNDGVEFWACGLVPI